MNAEAAFQLLADVTRRRILCLLVEQRELCVCELVAALDLIQPKVSRHLAAMRSAGLLQVRRQGTWMIYRLDSHLPAWLMQVIQGLHDGMAREATVIADRNRLAMMSNRPMHQAA